MKKEDKERIRRAVDRVPPWLFTVITVLAIIWLTLVPDPLGDDSPHLFPGADKVVHGLMFGGLTLVMLLDRQRSAGWSVLPSGVIWEYALAAASFGILIEFLQLWMGLGRGFEVADMVADTVGAGLFAFLWQILQGNWSLNNNDD